MAIRAVVFDIGGVLELTPGTGWVERWENRLELPAGRLAGLLRGVWQDGSLGHITLPDVEQRTSELLHLDSVTLEAFMDDIWGDYLGTLNGELFAYFTRLRERARTAILSNSFVGARERERDAYGFENACEFIVYSHEVGLLKPNPRIYELTCERLGLWPAEVLFLDDVESFVDGARSIGMHAVRFESNDQSISEIEAKLAENRPR